MTAYSAFTDNELHDWLVWADNNGSSFVRAIAEAALVADLNPNRENEGGGSSVREIDEERSRLRGKAQHGAASLRFSFADAALALQNRSRAVQFERFRAAKGDFW